MNIIQQPDALSLSRNLKPLVIGSSEPVSFEFKKGEDTLLSQRYEPGDNQRIEIDLREIIHAQLSCDLKQSGESYEQTNLAADFTAIIDGSRISFRVVKAGVDRLADTPTNFLKQNFLTWQPNVKRVTYSSPEFLTYYAVEDSTVKLKAVFTDSNETITFSVLESGKAWTMNLQYANVVKSLNGRFPAYYDVWVENASGQRMTYIQRYQAETAKSIHEDWVLFENSLGGIDTFRAYGTESINNQHTHNIAELDEEYVEYRVDTERLHTKNTGYLTPEESRWLVDFFPAGKKYIYLGDYLRSIVVTESEVQRDNKLVPTSYSFTYKYADARPLLNLPRTDEPADMLEIEIPEVGNFTIPPRLAEVPRLPLSEGDLFPVQNPYSETWSTTTTGALASVIGQILSAAAGDGGGIGHSHANIDLLNKLSYTLGYLLVNSEKIKAGYADEAGKVKDGVYIRKDQPDQTEYLVKFLSGLQAGKFERGVKGVGVYQDDTGNWHIETDYLDVRLKFTATTVEIQKAYHIGGAQIKSAASMKCVRVEELADTYRCYMNTTDDDGNEVTNDFRVNDQAYVNTFNLVKLADGKTGNHFLWRLVTAVGSNYIDLSKTVCAANSDAPLASDDIVLLGYQGTDDASRQVAVIDAGAGEGAPYYRQFTGINSFYLPEPETQLKPGANRLSGVLHIENGSTGAGNLSDLPEEVQKAAEFAVKVGGVNLLLNSGFTGNYETEELEADTMLEEESELYSKALLHWSGISTVQEDIESASGRAVILGEISQQVTLIEGEHYVISYKAKGIEIAVSCGEFGVTQPLTDSYQRYSHKFVYSGSGTVKLSGESVTLCEPQLERGTIATDWSQSPQDNDKAMAEFLKLKHLSDAIKDGSVDFIGGLQLTNVIQVGNYKDGKMQQVTGGLSGIYNDGNDVLIWGDGSMDKAIYTVMKYAENPKYEASEEELKNMANIVMTHGGMAILNKAIIRGYIYAQGGFFRGKIETFANGNRIVIDPATNSLVMYDSSDNEVCKLCFRESSEYGSYPELTLTRKNKSGDIQSVSVYGTNVIARNEHSNGDFEQGVLTPLGIEFFRQNDSGTGQDTAAQYLATPAVRVISEATYIQSTDEFLRFTPTSGITAYMPSPAKYPGKTYYIKLTSGSVRFTGGPFLNSKDWQPSDAYDLTDTIAIIMKSDGMSWCVFYCG